MSASSLAIVVSAEPGALLRGPALDLARTFPNQTEVSVEGRHYIQEQAPHAIGEAIAAWWPGAGRPSASAPVAEGGKCRARSATTKA